MKTAELLIRNVSYDGDGNKIRNDISKYKVNQYYTVYAAAPGTGRWIYLITKVDKQGVWGIELENNVRELTPSEVI